MTRPHDYISNYGRKHNIIQYFTNPSLAELWKRLENTLNVFIYVLFNYLLFRSFL